MQKWSLSLIFILLLAFGLACANEPQVVDQTSTSSLSAEQVEQIVSKALEAQAMETAAAPAGPTSEEIGAIVSEAVAEATSSSLSAEQVEQIVSKALEAQAMKPTTFESTIQDSAWTVVSRTVPPPAGASDAFRESIANTPQPSVAEHVKATTFSTDEEWIQVISAADSRAAQSTDALAKRLSVIIKEDVIAGVTVRWVTPAEIDPANQNRLFVHVHGGAYVLNNGLASAQEGVLIAHGAKMQVVSIDYSMPPERDPFPASIDDVVAVGQSLLEDRPAKSMMLGGTSAGGGLTLASTMKFRELGLDLPGALFAGTPWADLTKTGDTHFTNAGIDRLLLTYEGLLEGAAGLYADGNDLKTPLISPVYGDFTSFPPTILFSGTRDLLLSDTVRVHQKLRDSGIEADLHVLEAVSHGDYGITFGTPEQERFLNEISAFAKKHLETKVTARNIFMPSTISFEAQQVLNQLILAKPYTRAAPPASDLENWRKVHDAAEGGSEGGSKDAVASNNVTVAEANLGGVPILDIRPDNWADNGKVLVYTHGGAYTLFSARSTLPSSAKMSRATGLRTISVNYTTAPFAHWEEIQEQVISVFKALLAEGYAMNDIALYGDSAGGGLATSTVLNLRDRGMGMPSVVVLWSPWVDLTNAGDTAHTLKDAEPTLSYASLLEVSAQAFAGGLDLNDPRVSPINRDFSKGFPPTLIQAGTKEIFLSTAVRLYQKLEAAGQDTKLDVYEGMWHIFQQTQIPESEVAVAKSAAFINMHLESR